MVDRDPTAGSDDQTRETDAARQGDQDDRPLPSERRGYDTSGGYQAPAYGGAQGYTEGQVISPGQEGYRGYAPRTGRAGYEGTGGEPYGTSPNATPQSAPSAGRTNLGGTISGYGGPGAAEPATSPGGTDSSGDTGDAIVGGPPIDDVIVGGPPIDRTATDAPGAGDSGGGTISGSDPGRTQG
jgi:hypothetical protein